MRIVSSEAVAGSNSLFDRAWWLDAVAPGGWDAAVVERRGAVVARLPYRIRRRYGLTVLSMPPLTPALGPWIDPAVAGNPFSADYLGVVDSLVKALPRFDLFRQCCPPEVTDLLAFHWRGFTNTLRYTYRLDLSGPNAVDGVWRGLRPNIRRNVEKARRSLTVRNDRKLSDLYHLHTLAMSQHGRRASFDLGLLERLDEACGKHAGSRAFYAEDASGHLHAAAFVVWNSKVAYYLIGGSDPELRRSGAASLVMWEAIRFASSVAGSFDFEGSMVPSIAHFFAGFGAKQTPYYCLTRTSARLAHLSAGIELLQAPLTRVGLPARSWLEAMGRRPAAPSPDGSGEEPLSP